MSQSLKNWKPKEVMSFLLKNGFSETKKKKKGDHKCLFKKETEAYTEIDMGRKSFGARDMLTISKQSKIPRAFWKK